MTWLSLDLELDAALLAAEAAVGLHQALRLDARRELWSGHRREMRTEALDDANGIGREFRHRVTLPLAGLWRSGTDATVILAPGRTAPGGISDRSPGNGPPPGSSYRNPSSCSTTVRSRTMGSEAYGW